MIPSMSLSSSSSSSSSATVGVEKATSHLLIGPDWTMNMDICDSINSNHWDAKDVIKAVKKRLQHKNPKVQLLALTLLEAMVNNCGDYVHFQIAERNILQEMVKIVKKKTDMHVRDKILVLLDIWQEAFGGLGGKYPQYYWAYEDLRRSGVVFPQRSLDAAPIITPPVAQSTFRHAQAGYGMPSNSSTRLDQAMAAETETLSLSNINSMRNVLDLLADMLQAVNPTDRASVKDEVIVDLVSQCRSNQKRLMQMLTTTGDEELLSHGLELNDNMQSVLAKHDAIASGSPLPTQVTNLNAETLAAPQSSLKPGEVKETIQTPIANPSVPVVASVRGQIAEEEDEEDDFTQLARRHSKPQTTISQDTSTSNSHHDALGNANDNAISQPIQAAATAPVTSNALALVDPPVPIRATKEQDIIDLLSITLSTATASLQTLGSTPADFSQNIHQASVSGTTQEHPYSSHPHPVGHAQLPLNSSHPHSVGHAQLPLNSYVVPWAQPQPQPQTQTQTHPQLHPQPQSQFYPQSQSQSQPQPRPQSGHYPQPQLQSQTRPQYPQYSSGYIPPPWAPTPGYYSNQNNLSPVPQNFPTPQTNTPSSYRTVQVSRPLNSFPKNEETRVTTTSAAAGSKPFVPSYRLFEDLNVLGNGDGRFKMTSSTMPSLSGASSHSMVGGRK